MSTVFDVTPASDRELVLGRLLDAPPEHVFRAWTVPALIVRWFAPFPFTTTRAESDLRAGGSCLVVMRGPDGTEFPSAGVYLEVVPNRRLVFTDAFVSAWVPSQKPFMTVAVTFDGEGGRTRYTARAMHWSVADREQHEAMGFHQGWGLCADQLEAVAASLR